MAAENPNEPPALHADDFDLYTEGTEVVVQARTPEYDTVTFQTQDGTPLEVSAGNVGAAQGGVTRGVVVSDDGVQTVASATDINFADALAVTDDGDGTVTAAVSAVDTAQIAPSAVTTSRIGDDAVTETRLSAGAVGQDGLNQLDAGTITLDGATDPAFDGSAATTITTADQPYTVDLYISAGVAGSAYAFNYDHNHIWTGSSLTLGFTVNWDQRPSGASAIARWEVNEV